MAAVSLQACGCAFRGCPPSAGSLVSATLERNGESRTIIDTTNGNLVYSDYASLDQGLGEYILTVRKVKKSATAPDQEQHRTR